MNFEEEEREQILDSVKKLLIAELPKIRRDGSGLPSELFKSFGTLGIAGLSVPEEYSGMSADAELIALVMEEISAADLGAAIFLSVHCMVAGLIARHGSAQQKKLLLPKMAKGECLGAFALTEPSAGSDAAALKSSYKSVKDGYSICGEKCYITSAGWAGIYIVFARAEGTQKAEGITAFLLEIPESGGLPKGLSIAKPEKKMGAELSPIASLSFDNLFIPSSHILGNERNGYKVALSGLAGGRVNIAACANGLSRAAISIALSHLNNRAQFGAKLIEFQGLQFMLADMYKKLAAAKLLTRQAAIDLSLDPDSQSARLSPSVAKCFASDSAMEIATDAVQLLGGAGYIADYKAEKLMRDAKMLQIVEGTNQIQRIIIAREMQKLF